MSNQNALFDDRSGEVQEVLGTPPSWLVRYGTLMAFVVLVGMACLSVMVEYPDVVPGDITVFSSDPARKLFAAQNNYIDKVLVSNEDTVERGQILVVFQSNANFEDISHLEDLLLSIGELNDSVLLNLAPPKDLLLGELQPDIYEFFDKQNELRMQYTRLRERPSERELRSRLRQTEQLLYSERSRKESLSVQLDLVKQRQSYSRNLFLRKEINYSTLRQIEEEIIALEREMQGLESSIRSRQFEIDNIKRQINGLQVVNRESLLAASGRLEESFVRLQNKVELWKKDYLLTSPIRGVVLFTNDNLSPQQYVASQTQLMDILPTVKTETVGRMMVDLRRSGQVKTGQRVVVKLSSFTFSEFGAVIGQVKWKGTVPNNDSIMIEVGFPEGLITNRGKEIDPIRELKGEAKIITQDKKFVERIFGSRRRPAS